MNQLRRREILGESHISKLLPSHFPRWVGGEHPILVDGDVLWYGCGDQLCRMDAAGTRVFGRESGLPDRELQTILKDGAGNLWVRAQNAGVFERPAGETRFQRPKLPFSPENIGGVPAVDDDGRILLPYVGLTQPADEIAATA